MRIEPESILDVLIVGSGFSGIAMAIKLQAAGIQNFLIAEKGEELGGTWRDNRYPGAACDIPSHLYSYSFEPKSDWSRIYPRQPEIQAYLHAVAKRHGLDARLRLSTQVTGATWESVGSRWRVTTAEGAVFLARALICGVGALHEPAYPVVPGLDTFRGAAFHSSRWDQGCDLAGKRVAVVGTGASAIQFVPAIAPQVAKLHVFQRTAPWILPKLDRPISGMEKTALRLPLYRRAFRGLAFGVQEIQVNAFLRVTMMTRGAQWAARQYLAYRIKDADLRRKLTPDYTFGCKRVLLSADYYPALTRGNVELVTEPIVRVREGSVVTADGTERPVDAIVFGTGYKVSGGLERMNIVGRERTLREAWAGGMQAYRGITVGGFPNLFLLYGPNTGLGHNSTILMIEAQVGYVIGCLEAMRAGKIAAIEPKPDVQKDFVEAVQTRLSHSVWQAGGCTSWYHDASGRNTAIWPGTVAAYRKQTRHATLEDYALVAA